MIDLDKYKTWQRNRPSKTLIETTAIYHHDFDELIQALSEAKEIMKSDMPESAQYQRWLSRYFQDNEKE